MNNLDYKQKPILAELKSNNEHYSKALSKEKLEDLKKHHPKATIVCCSDSRFPPELIFAVEEGELFVVRIAGNFVEKTPEILDAQKVSISYAVNHLHSPEVIVMGHYGCGAINLTFDEINNYDSSNPLFRNIAPAINKAINEVNKSSSELASKSPTELKHIICAHATKLNVINTILSIRESNIIPESTQIIGAICDENRVVDFFYNN